MAADRPISSNQCAHVALTYTIDAKGQKSWHCANCLRTFLPSGETGAEQECVRLRHDAEEYECAMMYLDDLRIPRAADGKRLSLVGRISRARSAPETSERLVRLSDLRRLFLERWGGEGDSPERVLDMLESISRSDAFVPSAEETTAPVRAIDWNVHATAGEAVESLTQKATAQCPRGKPESEWTPYCPNCVKCVSASVKPYNSETGECASDEHIWKDDVCVRCGIQKSQV